LGAGACPDLTTGLDQEPQFAIRISFFQVIQDRLGPDAIVARNLPPEIANEEMLDDADNAEQYDQGNRRKADNVGNHKRSLRSACNSDSVAVTKLPRPSAQTPYRFINAPSTTQWRNT
jgi:hypothetical protein